MTRTQITALLALVVITWGAWLYFAGLQVGVEHLKPFSLAVSVLFGAVTVFNLYLWRLPLFRIVLSDKPILAGAWRVDIESNFVDETTGVGKKVDAYYVVRQTYLQLSIRVITRETTSKTLSTQLTKDEGGEWTLHGTFLDTPHVHHRDKSVMHYGAFLLRLTGNPVQSFQGEYWTNRDTKGTVQSISHLPSWNYGSYEAISAAFTSTNMRVG